MCIIKCLYTLELIASLSHSLGGAPSNVAVHLASLFRSIHDSSSPTVAIAACVGNDQLGREAHRRFGVKGVRTDFIQYHEKWETGMATAILDKNKNGDASYEFNTPAAWDGLQLNDQMMGLMQNDDKDSNNLHTKLFIMGTISARLNDDQEATSSSTLKTIRNSAPDGTVVLDVNLRSPYYTPELVLELAKGLEDKKLALLKLNEEELCILEEWCGLNTVSSGESGDEVLAGSVIKQRMEQLATSLNTQRVCVTRGENGAALLCIDEDKNNNFYENEGYALTTNNDSDTVGAGDAFLAALVCALFIQHESPEKALERACALGAYVASCRGATPEHEDAPDDLRSIFYHSR